MNNDIRISISFRGHRKRIKLEKTLGPKATSCLIDLWLTVAEQRPDGHLKGWDEGDIALAAGYKRDPSKFVKGLIDCGFLEKDDNGYQVHEWEKHQPWACGAEHRSEMARKAATARWKGQEEQPTKPTRRTYDDGNTVGMRIE